jgi:hypothetical protein
MTSYSVIQRSSVGSPTSPKSVLHTSFFEHDRDAPKITLPAITNTTKSIQHTAIDTKKHEEEMEQCYLSYGTFTGNDPYQGRFFVQPAKHILLPILRTILRSNPPVSPVYAWNRIVDDVLVHRLGLTADDKGVVYVGRIMDKRVVLVKNNHEEFRLICPDEDTAGHFMMLLQAHDIQTYNFVGDDSYQNHLQHYHYQAREE